VTHGCASRKLDQRFSVEHISYEPHVPMETGLAIFDGTDPRRFLATVLQ
jgi:hypothetical protein